MGGPNYALLLREEEAIQLDKGNLGEVRKTCLPGRGEQDDEVDNQLSVQE